MRPYYEATGTRRVLRVAAGEGMLTPVRETTVTYRDGRTERLTPGRDRFSPDHALPRQRPELFTLCAERDRTAAPSVFRQMLARAERQVIRELEGDAPRTPTRRVHGRHQIRRPTRRPTRNKLR